MLRQTQLHMSFLSAWMFQKSTVFFPHVLTSQNSRLILPLHSFGMAFGLLGYVICFHFTWFLLLRSFVCCGCSARLMLSLWLLMGGVQLLDFRHRDIEDPLRAGDNKLYRHIYIYIYIYDMYPWYGPETMRFCSISCPPKSWYFQFNVLILSTRWHGPRGGKHAKFRQLALHSCRICSLLTLRGCIIALLLIYVHF